MSLKMIRIRQNALKLQRPLCFTRRSLSDVNKNESTIAITSKTPIEKTLDDLKGKLFEAMSVYEEAIGLKEIKEAQQSVLEAEKRFVEAQKIRRDLNTDLLKSQQKLRNLRDEMDRLSRTDSRYLQLFTEEHAILKNESNLMNEYKTKENEERDLFFCLSASLRDSQEKERARVERIKYLQLGLSIACTTLGILSAFIYSYIRSGSINQILNYETEQFGNVKELMDTILSKQDQLESIIATNQAMLKNDLLIIQNESLKLVSQIETAEANNKPQANTKSLVALIESALKEADKLQENINDDEESFNIDETNKVIEPIKSIETKQEPINRFISYLGQHTREIVVVSAAFLLGTFLINIK